MSAVRPPADNRTGRPERSNAVGQDELERALREMLSRQVDMRPAPVLADPADRIVRRAGRARRRRVAAGTAAAAVATALATAALGQFGGPTGGTAGPVVVVVDPDATGAPPGPVDPPTGGPVRAEVDLVVGTTLTSTNGQRVDLTGVGPVERAQRVAGADGWLLVGPETLAGRTLWSVRPGTAPRVLLAGARAIALSPDGRQVAWRDGRELVAAGVVGGQLVATVRVPAPARAVPTGFLGATVVVRPDALRPGYALWRPGAGPVPPGTNHATTAVYGARPGGQLVAQVRSGQTRRACLALLDAARALAPIHTDCAVEISDDGRGVVSPDGRWLLLNGRAAGDGDDRALLVDLTGLGAAAVRPAGPPLTAEASWVSPTAAVYVDGAGELVRVRVDRVLAGEVATGDPVTGVAPGDRPVVVTGSAR
ncbi:hypothetical protein [Micromonospora mirobrigensis]|uniref:WD40-like Beta Propeller Repeat n=1 Tax=Micromonospora mirobrigensis TaxID=262898 RepID=A0A1C4UXZ4_9ACTN|nr:hypothetical protein [Micromonospora mirobrigensis]SCE76598.1 hypothetical protein GA0070564_101804 [Micromonospora mirobrigensis]